MSDPRNVAHNKKVKQEKEHQGLVPGVRARKGREKKAAVASDQHDAGSAAAPTPVPTVEPAPGDVEESAAVLSKLKEMEFHSRANIETLAELSLTIEEELKQKEFSEPIGELYSAQDSFQTKIAAFIESYSAKCESLKSST